MVNLPRGSKVHTAEATKKMLGAAQTTQAAANVRQPSGGNVNVSSQFNIDARGAQLGVAEQIQHALAEYGSVVDRRAVAAVSSARQKGFAV